MAPVRYWVLLGAWLGAATAATSLTAHNTTNNVTYRGVYRSEVETFLSLQYGKDTAPPYRFKDPRPYTPAPGSTVDANSLGYACPQPLGDIPYPFYLSNVTDVSENCLLLNVYRPNGTEAGAKLPVMLFIHGDSFIGGSKDELISQPPGLILQSVANGHPVMAVNINYRLGVFGFAQSAALKKEGSENAGLKDQHLAIVWARDNIATFGGDPDKITIYGQSSGGLAVGMQIMAYGSTTQPFQQAICQSQALEPGITADFTRDAMNALVDFIGCNTTGLDSPATVRCLERQSMHALVHAQFNTSASGPADNLGDQWLPVVDGDFLPEAPSKLIQAGRFANVTAIIGWTQDDANPFTNFSIATNEDVFNFFSAYLPGFTAANVNKLLSLYPVSEFSADPSANLTAQFYRSGRILRDIVFTCQPIYYGQSISQKGANVYYYDQNQTLLEEVFAYAGMPGLGVLHTSEMAFVFGNLSHYNVDNFPYHPTASDFALRDRESRSWSTFATFGNPSLAGHDTLKGWKDAYSHPNDTDIFVIGGPHEGLWAEDGPRSIPAVRSQGLRQRCNFLNSPEIIKQLRY